FSSRRRHTRCYRDWSSDVCSSDLAALSIYGLGRDLFDRDAGRVAALVALTTQGLYVHARLPMPDMLMTAFMAASMWMLWAMIRGDRKSTRLNSSHGSISYAVFCLK